MKLLGPSFVFLEVHTTGVKTRALGHEAEKSVWSLMVDNAAWVSARSNIGVRTIGAVPAGEIAGDIDEFYPMGLRSGIQINGPQAQLTNKVIVTPSLGYTRIGLSRAYRGLLCKTCHSLCWTEIPCSP